MHQRLTKRVSLTILGLATSVAVLNFCSFVFLQSLGILESLVKPEVWCLVLFAFIFALAGLLSEVLVQMLQVSLILLLSGPMVLASPFAFFGMWFFVLGNILLYKYGFLNRWAIPKVAATTLYFIPFMVFSVLDYEGAKGSGIRIANYVIFLVSCLFFLYLIFEEEIRDLLAANRHKESAIAEKDTELAIQAAEIARLEPLSVLGERVAHVVHSFKNNLSLAGTVVFYLEQLHDEARAVTKLQEFIRTMNERIENILMVSSGSINLEPEHFDVARLLEGLQQVYLTEPSFSAHAKTELTVDGPLRIRAVRWDFILLVENILKNAIEAIREKGIRGTIRINLSEGRLTVANNGGALVPCIDCGDSCLDCRKFGHPGQTSKERGSGFGLTQVFGTCRKNGWGLKIRGSGEWTTFEITLS